MADVESMYQVTAEEYEYLVARKKQIAENERKVVESISDSILSMVNGTRYGEWSGFPGTLAIAKAVHRDLLDANILKKEKL
jgi:hypothetical protein